MQREEAEAQQGHRWGFGVGLNFKKKKQGRQYVPTTEEEAEAMQREEAEAQQGHRWGISAGFNFKKKKQGRQYVPEGEEGEEAQQGHRWGFGFGASFKKKKQGRQYVPQGEEGEEAQQGHRWSWSYGKTDDSDANQYNGYQQYTRYIPGHRQAKTKTEKKSDKVFETATADQGAAYLNKQRDAMGVRRRQ